MKNHLPGVREMAQRVRALVVESGNQRLVPESHMGEGNDQLLQADVLVCTVYTCTCTLKHLQ